MPFHEKWLEQCAEMAGLIIEQGLHEVCWEAGDRCRDAGAL